MNIIKKQFIIDENNRKVAVQIPIEDFEKIEQALEDYALGKLIAETDEKEDLSVNEAKSLYQNLLKKDEGSNQ